MGKNKKWVQLAILAAVILIGGLTMANSLFSSDKVPRTGDKAPDFKLAGTDGKTYKLSDFRGKSVVVNFWGTYCKPCKEEMPAIQKSYERFMGKGVAVLGVNMGESAITASSFANQVKATFPIVLDEDETIRRRYGVNQYPTTFFVKPDGVIGQIHVGQMDEPLIENALTALTGSR
jgi:peroxiredoxin